MGCYYLPIKSYISKWREWCVCVGNYFQEWMQLIICNLLTNEEACQNLMFFFLLFSSWIKSKISVFCWNKVKLQLKVRNEVLFDELISIWTLKQLQLMKLIMVEYFRCSILIFDNFWVLFQLQLRVKLLQIRFVRWFSNYNQ